MSCQAELLTHRNSAVSRGFKEGWVAVDGHGSRWQVTEVATDSHRQNGDEALHCSTSLLSYLGLKDECLSVVAAVAFGASNGSNRSLWRDLHSDPLRSFRTWMAFLQVIG